MEALDKNSVVVTYCNKGVTSNAAKKYIIQLPLDVIKVGMLLIIYFIIMFSVSFYISHKSGIDYKRTTTLTFTAASNNFDREDQHRYSS